MRIRRRSCRGKWRSSAEHHDRIGALRAETAAVVEELNAAMGTMKGSRELAAMRLEHEQDTQALGARLKRCRRRWRRRRGEVAANEKRSVDAKAVMPSVSRQLATQALRFAEDASKRKQRLFALALDPRVLRRLVAPSPRRLQARSAAGHRRRRRCRRPRCQRRRRRRLGDAARPLRRLSGAYEMWSRRKYTRSRSTRCTGALARSLPTREGGRVAGELTLRRSGAPGRSAHRRTQEAPALVSDRTAAASSALYSQRCVPRPPRSTRAILLEERLGTLLEVGGDRRHVLREIVVAEVGEGAAAERREPTLPRSRARAATPPPTARAC